MVELTKARINLKEGIIELEGSEDFVMKMLDKYDKNLNSSTVKVTPPIKNHQVKPVILNRETTRNTPNGNMPSLINLKGNSNKPSLLELYKKKSPQTYQEAVTLFVYYISKYLGIQDVQVGHIISCFDEVGAKKPKQIEPLFQEIKLFSGWLDLGKETHTTRITEDGVNFVEQFLPKSR